MSIIILSIRLVSILDGKHLIELLYDKGSWIVFFPHERLHEIGWKLQRCEMKYYKDDDSATQKKIISEILFRL